MDQLRPKRIGHLLEFFLVLLHAWKFKTSFQVGRVNIIIDPYADSSTKTLLRLLLPNDKMI